MFILSFFCLSGRGLRTVAICAIIVMYLRGKSDRRKVFQRVQPTPE